MSHLQDLSKSPKVQFIQLPQATRASNPEQSILLKQGQSVVLVKGGVSVKIANNKFHSLKATTYVLVRFGAQAESPQVREEEQNVHQVGPALVGTTITCSGEALARITVVQSKSKLLTIVLMEGVKVVKDLK